MLPWRHAMTKKITITAFLLSASWYALCQPYIDIVNTRYLHSPATSGSSSGGQAIKMDYYNISTTLPFQFKKSKDAIILSPYYETWKLHTTGGQSVQGIILPLSYLKNSINSKWSVLTTLIARINKETGISPGSNLQWGGALIAGYTMKEGLVYKLGMYYNKEFFGNFFMPLAGIDWQINKKNNLFGVLPGSMSFEHKVKYFFYYGATFRAITNSYRLPSADPCFTDCTLKEYLRIDDNQLGLFADLYLNKHLLLNIEAGHSIYRKIQQGMRGDLIGRKQTTISQKDNFYAKAAFAYRLRFR
jgi:hypothetical protein